MEAHGKELKLLAEDSIRLIKPGELLDYKEEVRQRSFMVVNEMLRNVVLLQF